MSKIGRQRDFDKLPLHLKIKRERMQKNQNVDPDDINKEVSHI
jgi:hypothetical protein